MKKYLSIFVLLILYLFYLNCKRVTDPIYYFPKSNTVYFYLADSSDNACTNFHLNQNIFFHFGIINNQDSVLSFTKGHGGPPVVSFHIFKSDSLFGTSDEGYCYPMVVTGGIISPHDTLQYSTDWSSNPYHENNLELGEYYTVIHPYIWFDDFDLSSLLDTVYFEIIE